MRLVIDSLIALMLVGLLAGILIHHRKKQHEVVQKQQVHTALARLHEQVLYRSALGDVELSESGFPSQVSSTWFGAQVPTNPLAPQQPWLDVAAPGDWSDHPGDPVITRTSQAGFWYNPNRGIFRARIFAQLSEMRTLDLYNQVNGTLLRWLPEPREETRIAQEREQARNSDGDIETTSDDEAEREDRAAPPDDAQAPTRTLSDAERPTLNDLVAP